MEQKYIRLNETGLQRAIDREEKIINTQTEIYKLISSNEQDKVIGNLTKNKELIEPEVVKYAITKSRNSVVFWILSQNPKFITQPQVLKSLVEISCNADNCVSLGYIAALVPNSALIHSDISKWFQSDKTNQQAKISYINAYQKMHKEMPKNPTKLNGRPKTATKNTYSKNGFLGFFPRAKCDKHSSDHYVRLAAGPTSG